MSDHGQSSRRRGSISLKDHSELLAQTRSKQLQQEQQPIPPKHVPLVLQEFIPTPPDPIFSLDLRYAILLTVYVYVCVCLSSFGCYVAFHTN